jgi:hypothetical protein
MKKVILCSNCFKDQGLKLDATKIGYKYNRSCPNCKTKNGKKLNLELIAELVQRFFVRGTVHKTEYGAAPVVQFNKEHYLETDIDVSEWLKDDMKLLEDTLKIGFFHNGPRLWMIGEVEPLKALKSKVKRNKIISRVLEEYPTQVFSKEEIFYRVRKEPKNPADFSEYDSPPDSLIGRGRLDSAKLPVMYGSQDLEVCIHECRVTIEDDLFLATLNPTKDLKLLDLTEVICDRTSEFESLDIAIHMLFMAGEHSYEISREIALAAYNAGFDGMIYPSYFSLVRTGVMPLETIYGLSIRIIPPLAERARTQIIQNIGLFGRPIKNGIVSVKCINRLILNKVIYDIQFGPVHAS